MTETWQEALLLLHERGWESDDIDAACEAVDEACSDGAFEGSAIEELSPADVVDVLEEEVSLAEAAALLQLAAIRGGEDADDEADDLLRALYDLDAFAYEHGEED